MPPLKPGSSTGAGRPVENGARRPEHGVASSPLVVDDVVVVLAGGPGGRSLVAYDARTGERRWSGGDDPAAYSSPRLATLGGVRQIVVFSLDHLSSHDARTGAVLWRDPWPERAEKVSQPVVLDGDRVFVSAGYGVGSRLLKVSRTEDGPWSPEVLWRSRQLQAKFTHVVSHGGFLYGLDEGVLICPDPKDGERRWKSGRGQYPDTATTQMAAGFLYDRLGEDKRADDHFERALQLSKNDPNVMNNYAAFLCRKGDKKQGEAYFIEAGKNRLYRSREIAYANAGRCPRAAGRPKEAEQYFRQALAIKAEQVDALFEMASLYHEMGNELQARAFLERYAATAPASAASLWLAYRIERALGDYAQAKKNADRSRRDFPTSPEMGLLLDAERTSHWTSGAVVFSTSRPSAWVTNPR